MPEGLRTHRIGALVVACNFGGQTLEWRPPAPARALLGAATIAPRGVAVWAAP
jgi:hypothetical protein